MIRLTLAFAFAVSTFACLNSVHSQDDLAIVLKAQQERIAGINKAKKAAVSVFAAGGNGGGSGVVVTPDGYALTNFHVVKPAGTFMKCSMPDGVLYDAVIVGIDAVGDVALIKLLGRDDFPYAEMADSDKVRAGDWCFAVGNPFLLATDFQPTVTYGIVSGVHRYQYPAGTLLEYADCIQTDASINPGNSGGPLFNAKGQLIGINGRGSFEKRGRVNVGVGYAISINQIKNFMGYLRSGRIVDHATLGASVSTDDEGRVVVTNIIESCDAWRRGLRYGDEVVAFGGRPITTTNAFKNVLGIYPRGWRVPLSYRRDGERVDILVRLQGVHSREDLLAKIQPGAAPEPNEGDPKPPGPIPVPKKPGSPVPAKYADHFKARRGFANYYFNELNRDRIWDTGKKTGDFTSATGQWEIKGSVDNVGDVSFVLENESATANWAGEVVKLDAAKDLDKQLGPKGSGGMLVALHLWRRYLTLGPGKYGEVIYIGTAPDRNAEMADVLQATQNVVETRMLFDPQTGKMTDLAMYPDTVVDPCEIEFDEFKKVDGKMFPHKITVRNGDQVIGVIKVKSVTFGPAKEEA